MLSFLLHGWNSWKTAKGVALLAICALAVGIGSATSIFTVIQAVLLTPLPYANPDRYLSVWGGQEKKPDWIFSLSYLDSLDIADRLHTVDAFGCVTTGSFNVTFNNTPVTVTGTQMSPGLPESIHISPVLGRWFTPRDDTYTTVISSSLWRRYGSPGDIVGKPVKMNGRSYTVLGVMPAWFRLPPDVPDNEIWVPLNPDPDQRTHRGYHYLACIAKMKPGVTESQARADLKQAILDVIHAHPGDTFFDTVRTFPLLDRIVQDIRPTLLLLLGASGILLLITCANVAGLLLARTVARARETAVRVALGAARWQLGLQYFAEGLTVSLLGAAAGSALSWILVRFLLTLAADQIPRSDQIALNWRVLLFALSVAVLCGLLFSLAPLWQAMRTPPQEVLSDGARASASARSRYLLRAFVVAEIALAFGLLSVGGIFLLLLTSLYHVNPGFDPNRVETMNLFAPALKYPTDPARMVYETKLLKAVNAIPGVEEAGFTSRMPLTGCSENADLIPENGNPVDVTVEQRFISPGYFHVMKIPLIQGRFFTGRDTSADVMPLIINQTAAHLFWPRGNALGSYARPTSWDNKRFRIVGIVGDTRNQNLGRPTCPEMYFNYLETSMERMSWAVRTRLEEAALRHAIERAVQSVDPEQPIFSLMPLSRLLDQSVTTQKVQSFMVSFFALSALLLAMLGVYGVVSYAVRQRTTEIGTRMAVGATSKDLLSLVVWDGLKMAALGVGIGLALALGLAYWLGASTDFNIHVTTPVPFLAATLIVTVLTVLACFFPAWRATLVSPMVAIRNDPASTWQQTRWAFFRLAEHVSGLVNRTDEQAATSEAGLLAEIADSGRQAGSFPEALSAALSRVRERLGAESLALFVQKGPGHPYRCLSVVPDACGPSWVFPSDALLVGRLRHYGGALPVSRPDLDSTARWALENAPAHLPEIQLIRDVGAALVLRVAVKSEISGVLFVGSPTGRDAYNALDKRLLRGVTSQLAMMVENSRLTDRIVEQERLRRELLLASEVQKRLFPENWPTTSHLQLAGVCVPARGVGGDYYDFLDLGNRQIGIALADVAGKGIAAALIMSVVQASLRSLAGNNGSSLADLASKMNRLLHRSTGSNSYATFFYAQLDQDKQQLRYVNAGHNPPYLLRNGELHTTVPFVASVAPTLATIEELTAGGTIIGMFAQSSYEEAILDLHPGDVLIAFTDGVPEAMNPADEEFGEDRVKDALRAFAHLPVNEMAARLSEQLTHWISDAAQYDDMTFIILKVS